MDGENPSQLGDKPNEFFIGQDWITHLSTDAGFCSSTVGVPKIVPFGVSECDVFFSGVMFIGRCLTLTRSSVGPHCESGRGYEGTIISPLN